MNDLQAFQSSEFGTLDVVMISGKPFFPGTQCARILGYANPQKAIRDHCKGVNETVTPTKGGNQTIKIISEGDLYRLIARSNLPSAIRFERWVFDEVLPSIRQVGLYATPEAARKLLEDPDFLIEALKELKTIRTQNVAQKEVINIQNQQIAEMKPKASYYDLVLNCKDAVAISVIAKDYGKSAQWLNDLLHQHGVQYKQGKIWLLYQRHAEQGYTVTKTHSYPGKNGQMRSKVHTYWTQKGRLFIYQLLKSINIYPLIERGSLFDEIPQ
jgi:anti-repressor protein